MKRSARLLLLICLLLLASTLVHAQDDPIRTLELASLRGLNKINVVVVSEPRGGVDVEYVKTGVELKLRSVGLKVVSKDDAGPNDGFLWITITALKIEGLPVYACSLSVELKQGVNLPRDPRLWVLGATWQRSAAVAIGQTKLQEGVRSDILQYVERFANDYLSANGR